MSTVALIGTGWVGVSLIMIACWLWQLRSGDAGLVDVAWAASIGALGVFYAFGLERGDPALRYLVAGLAAFWGLRLALNLVLRGRGRAEDGRYRAMRAHWGKSANTHLLWFFLVQAVLAVLFSLPLLAAMVNERAPGSSWLVAGVGVWAVAMAGEFVADAQLNRFRADLANQGRTCQTGLWRYSRHPNYFFEWLHWFAYPLLAVGSAWTWIAWLGPVLMYLFVRHLTGVPYTELQAAKSRPDYVDYQANTNAFFLWFPRHSAKPFNPEKSA